MGSLSNAIGVLEGVQRLPLHRLCLAKQNNGPRNLYSKEDVELLLDDCPSPEVLADWHNVKLNWVRNEAICTQLDHLCSKVYYHLASANDKIIQLEYWIMDPELVDCDNILVGAFTDLILALKEFDVVSKDPILQVRHHMEMVLHYLSQVFRITAPIAQLACGSDDWDDLSMYWTENTYIQGLRSFRFDDLDQYLRSQKPDKSLAGLVSYHLSEATSANSPTDSSSRQYTSKVPARFPDGASNCPKSMVLWTPDYQKRSLGPA